MAEAPAYDGFLAERLAPIVLAAQAQFKFSHIVAGASAISRSVLPRVAAKLDVSPISDIIAVKDAETFVRFACMQELYETDSLLGLSHVAFSCTVGPACKVFDFESTN